MRRKEWDGRSPNSEVEDPKSHDDYQVSLFHPMWIQEGTDLDDIQLHQIFKWSDEE